MPRTRGTKDEISDKKRQFGMWLGLPLDARNPKKQIELANQLGVSLTTLTHWKKDKEVLGAKESAVKMLGGNEMYGVTQKLVEKAKEGSFQHQRLFLEWQGQIGGKQSNKPEPVLFELRYATKKDRNSN